MAEGRPGLGYRMKSPHLWVTDTPVSGWVSNNGAGLVVGLEVSPTRRKLDIQIPKEEYVYITAQPSTLRQGHTMYPGCLEPRRATPAYTCVTSCLCFYI